MVALIAELALPLQHVQRRNELWPLPQPLLLLLEEVLVLVVSHGGVMAMRVVVLLVRLGLMVLVQLLP